MAEYIEREAVLKHLRECEGTPPEIGYTYQIFKALECFVEDVPAADVAQVRHGQWGVEVGMNFFKERNCPVCKKRIESNFWNYCPNCGAIMDLK